MVTSQDLFQLIHSLSKTEKVYFKKNSSVFLREGGNNYLRLFDAIEAQESYNEQKILQQFKGEKFIRQLSVAKNYLYNRILDTMQGYHTSILTAVHGLMNKAEYVFEKGLYSQSDKLLRMAEKLAQKHEMHSTIITIRADQKFDYAVKKRETRIAEQNIEQSQKEVRLLNNHLEYLKLITKTQHVYNLYGKTKNKKYLQAFKKIMQNPLLKDESQALTFNSKRRFYDIHAVYNSVLEKEEKAYRFSQKIISLFDAHPEKKKYIPVNYAGYFNNTLLFCHFLRKYPEMERYLEKLNEIRPMMRSKYEKARFFEIYTNNCLSLHNTTGEFEKARNLLPSLLEEIPEHEKKLAASDKRMIFSNIANTFFGFGDHKSCLAWINKIRNELAAGTRPDFESEINLLNIIVHNELGHADLVPHLVTSYYRFLSKKQMMTKAEKYLLAYFKKLGAAATEERIIRRMTELRDQLASLSTGSSSSPFFFDIVSWLESKIEKRSFAEIVKEKAKKYQA